MGERLARDPAGVVEALRAARVVPVVTIEDAAGAVPLAAGARRGRAAGDRDHAPDAGRARGAPRGRGRRARRARRRGHGAHRRGRRGRDRRRARFVVSPGLVDAVVAVCRRRGVLALPGVATPDGAACARSSSAAATVKLFPAAVLGGPALIRALTALGTGADVRPDRAGSRSTAPRPTWRSPRSSRSAAAGWSPATGSRHGTGTGSGRSPTPAPSSGRRPAERGSRIGPTPVGWPNGTAPAGSTPRSDRMRTLVVIEFLSLDGVMQSLGQPRRGHRGRVPPRRLVAAVHGRRADAVVDRGHHVDGRLPVRPPDVREVRRVLADAARREPDGRAPQRDAEVRRVADARPGRLAERAAARRRGAGRGPGAQGTGRRLDRACSAAASSRGRCSSTTSWTSSSCSSTR